MNKLFIIIGAISILLILLGVWLYMLLFNQPSQDTNDLFANFNFFGDQADTPIPLPDPEQDTDPQVNVGASTLRQLTTRPVIGFTEVFATSTEPVYITYAEAGTGHLYQINMEDGEEERISNTTIPNASVAALSPDSEAVAIRSGFNVGSSVVYGTLNGSGGLDNRPLAVNVYDFTFANDGTLLYSESTATGLRARALTPASQTSITLFELPFRAAEIVWSRDDSSPHHVYTKPNTALRSHLYQVVNEQLIRQPITGTGITASANDNFIVYNQLFTTEHVGFVYDKVLNTRSEVPIVPVAEKCAFANTTSHLLYCGYDITIYDNNFPESWYKGTISLSDRIWEIDVRNGAATQLTNPLQVAGREIDIIDMTASADTPMLYFINKHDQTLWSYER